MKVNRKCCPLNLVFSLLVACNFVAADAPRTQQKDEIKAIGLFANVKSDGEHAYGYSVELWFRGKGLIGLVDHHRGLVGDPPMGILTDIRYNASTGAISFKAKLTVGLHSCKEHKDVPSHELLSFHGFLKADQLEGNIVLENQNDSLPVLLDSRQNFLMRKDPDSHLENYESYNAWWRHWEPIYRFRGAKW